MSDWAKEMEEAEQMKCQLPAPITEYDKDKRIKREISFQRDEDGNLFKVISELQVEVRKLSKSIARRKEWKKFGAAESDGPGPASANTYPAEEVFLQFVSGRPEDEADKQADELKMPKNIATCRICRGPHFTTRCPFKDRQDILDADQQATPNAATPSATAAGASTPGSVIGGTSQGTPVVKEAGGKYIPPGLRQAAAGGASPGGPGGMDKRRDDQPTIRVTNLPEDTTEEDLGNLFNPFGKIHRIFLAKDKLTMVSKGFAFITYQRKEDAQKAIVGVSGFGYGHLILKVEWAKPANE